MVVSRLDDEPEIVENVEASARLEEESNRSEPSDSASDPEDDNDDDSEEDEKSTKARFNEILAELRASGDKIKVGNLDLGDSADRNKFMRHNKAFLREKIQPKNQTFLHLIADSDKKSLKFHKRGIKKLVTDLIQLEDEDLLAQPDQDGKTPLFCAILLKNYRLVKTMCEAHKDIQSVIRIQKGTAPSTNCLHQAIMNQTTTEDDELLKELITLSGPETLCAMNEKGLTPLHLAVEYQRCDEAQCEIVQALVERCDDICPEALDKDYFFKHEDKDRSKSKDTLSVYRYCEHSFEEYQAEQKLRSPENGVRANQKATKSTVLDERSEVTDKNQKPEKNEKQRGKLAAEDAVAPRPLRKQSTWSEAPPGKYGIKHELMKPPSAHIGAPTGKFGTRNETVKPTKEDQWVSNVLVTDFGSVKDRPQTPKQNKEPPKTSKKPNPKSQPRESNKEAIKQYLKRYYLRKKNHDEAVEFLCGSRQESQIYFDLFGIGPILSESRIQHGLETTRFEDVLQYVAVPLLKVEADVSESKSKKRPAPPECLGRRDLEVLFRWLKQNKGVKTIFRVIVDDLQGPAHSDEAIESCLTNMGVEVWDWRRLDLSSEVIFKVCPQAREVHLYWGGNEAVLRGWSEAEGLKKLKELEKVYLHTRPGLETYSRTAQYKATFKSRLENGTKIKVHDTNLRTDKADGPSSGPEIVRDFYERHKWVASMKEFAYFMQVAEEKASLELKRDIVVGLIDDGVDINDPSIQWKTVISGGRSFCYRDKEQNLNQSHYVSGGGHGTTMAKLICKVCPNVKLFVLRLNEFPPLEAGKRQITAESAAKAVRAATDKKVDIISMSWTIEKTDRNGDGIAELNRAIEAAAEQNILMFCAATDQGAVKDQSYPAASYTKRIFKIGAASASGATRKSVGDPTAVDFIFPGHQVITEEPGDSRVTEYTAHTGSSVATALAAGLAAQMLYCVQLGAIHRDRDNPDLSKFWELKNHERMEKAMLRIGATSEKYLRVWERFSTKVKKADNEFAHKLKWIEYVTELADELMWT